MTPMCVCAAWIVCWVIGYWCLTLLGWRFLAPIMVTVRQASVSVGTIGLIAAFLLAEPGERPILRVAPLIIGVAAALYAYRNQWLFPRPAVELQACKLEPAPEALVAVLPGGEAVCLSVLSRSRTSVRGNTLLVHCGLARSLAAFTRPGGSHPAAILPHATGFEIGTGEQNWDGVDGKSLSGEEDLVLQPLELCRYATWREAHALGALLAAPAQQSIPPDRTRKPRVPGSGAVQDPLAWGRIDDKQWVELSADAFETTEPAEAPQCFLGRWAAAARGLIVNDDEPAVETADDDNSG